MLTIVNTNSPRRVDGPMLQGLMEMARHGQPVVVTPFTLAGAMSPVSLAGALSLQNAEALALIAFIQMVRPGAPAVYGGFTSNVDMRTGAPAFGTPEYAKAVLAGGQLSRRYRIPYRSSNVNSSPAVDAQAAYESGMSLWATVLAHTNLIYHGAGWLEGGLVASFEKMVLDAELLQQMAEILQPLEVTDDTLALDAIREVGPGGHFFGAAHLWRVTRRPFIARCCRTGATSKLGARRAQKRPPNARMQSGSGCWRLTNRRRSTRASGRRSTTMSHVAGQCWREIRHRESGSRHPE